MFNDFDSDMGVGIKILGSLTRENAKVNVTIKHTAGS
jgi:hypothetical protein